MWECDAVEHDDLWSFLSVRSGSWWVWLSPSQPPPSCPTCGVKSGRRFFSPSRWFSSSSSLSSPQLWPPLCPLLLLTAGFVLRLQQVTAPYLHVGGVLLMTALAWPIALHFFRLSSRGEVNTWFKNIYSWMIIIILVEPDCVCISVRRGLILGVYLSVLSALYLVPLGLYSPCIKEEWTLGPAPALIGHRGAPMVSRQGPTT